MKTSSHGLSYEAPADIEIFEAYLNKNGRAKRADIRRMRRALRKLSSGALHWRHS